MNHPVIIVGGGLSGLRAASLLNQQGIECKILEARDRIGGRVLSSSVSDNPDLGRFDLGPTWFWPQYESSIVALIEELNLETFNQYNKGDVLLERFQIKPPERCVMQEQSDEQWMRLTGGIQSLIEALAETLPAETVKLETRVQRIQMNEAGDITVEAKLADGTVSEMPASAVILALPPRLVARHIEFSPSLPPALIADIVEKPTWMAEQAKAVAVYERPFWREQGLSGFVLSSVGPLQEIYDASPIEGGGALFGFFGLPAETRAKLGDEEVVKLVANQLVKLFGSEAENPQAILYKDWSSDAETTVEEDFTSPKNFASYGQPAVEGKWRKKIIFAGTETNAEYSGHLEGALQSAEQAVLQVMNLNDK